MAFRCLHLFPILIAIVFPATFITTYLMSVLEGHVEADFPYISDTGAHPPESCVFGQFLNIGAALLATAIFIRYKQVKDYTRNLPKKNLQYLNYTSLWLGYLAALGISMVGNFQEINVPDCHYLGAIMCFGLGTIFLWIHTYFTYRFLMKHVSTWVFVIKCVTCVVCLLSFLATRICSRLATPQYHGTDWTNWLRSDGGWQLHVASTYTEWILAFSFCTHMCTFVQEFLLLEMEHPKFRKRVDDSVSNRRSDPPIEMTALAAAAQPVWTTTSQP